MCFTKVQNSKKHSKNSHLIIHYLSSSGVIERSRAEYASEASSQANEWAVWANEQTDERVAQYFSQDSGYSGP